MHYYLWKECIVYINHPYALRFAPKALTFLEQTEVIFLLKLAIVFYQNLSICQREKCTSIYLYVTF